MRTKVLVTGANGQLGQTIRAIANQYPTLDFLFLDKDHLDVTNASQVLGFFKSNALNWCINAAAYTAVDNAETHPEQAYQINVLGANHIAKACHEHAVKLIHISTDFVFDGEKNAPYKENDTTNPLGVYGLTKLEAENAVKAYCSSHFIIRTSWLYSEFGDNFMKTMVRLASERDLVRVVSDQIGAPTYARDLAVVLINIILGDRVNYGTFHYSNQGQISWFEFAKAIFEEIQSSVRLEPILTKDYVTLAKRPLYSVLDTSKIETEMSLRIPFWRESLIAVLSQK